jgi:hypothetical protein
MIVASWREKSAIGGFSPASVDSASKRSPAASRAELSTAD